MRPVGGGARKRSASRVGAYLARLLHALIFLSFAVAVLFVVQAAAHPFDKVIKTADVELAALDRALDANIVSGISLGAVILIIAVVGISAAGKGVHRRQYVVSFWRGLLSSAIFLLADSFNRFVRDWGRLYYAASIALFIAVTLVLVEIMARWGRAAEEKERRTEFLASIVSGLCFALIVQLGEVAIGRAGALLRGFLP